MQNTNDVQHIQTTITELREMTDVIFAVEPIQPLGLIGAVGIAKTTSIKTWFRDAYAEHRGVSPDEVKIVHERVANRDAAEIAGVALPCKIPETDAAGAPVLDANGNPRMIMGTQFTKPPVLLTIERHVADGYKYGILLLDELMQAGQDVQKVLSDVLDPDERTIASHPLPEGWIVAFTGNRARDKSGATRLLSMLTNRALVGELNFDVTQWSQWAIGAGVNQAAIDAAVQHTDADTGLGFFHDSVPSQDGPFCTPRSLERCARHLDAYMSSDKFNGEIPESIRKLLGMNVGTSAAEVIADHVEMMVGQVPSAAEIFANPETASVPDQMSYQYVACQGAINQCDTPERGDQVLIYLERCRADLKIQMAMALSTRARKQNWHMTSPIATTFIAKYPDLFALARGIEA
jgi:hypothetical protein|tara:strand:+ start:100 stop:1317 length:1218 start_codon:yes stop_codon:yes gene_type:complete